MPSMNCFNVIALDLPATLSANNDISRFEASSVGQRGQQGALAPKRMDAQKHARLLELG